MAGSEEEEEQRCSIDFWELPTISRTVLALSVTQNILCLAKSCLHYRPTSLQCHMIADFHPLPVPDLIFFVLARHFENVFDPVPVRTNPPDRGDENCFRVNRLGKTAAEADKTGWIVVAAKTHDGLGTQGIVECA